MAEMKGELKDGLSRDEKAAVIAILNQYLVSRAKSKDSTSADDITAFKYSLVEGLIKKINAETITRSTALQYIAGAMEANRVGTAEYNKRVWWFSRASIGTLHTTLVNAAIQLVTPEYTKIMQQVLNASQPHVVVEGMLQTDTDTGRFGLQINSRRIRSAEALVKLISDIKGMVQNQTEETKAIAENQLNFILRCVNQSGLKFLITAYPGLLAQNFGLDVHAPFEDTKLCLDKTHLEVELFMLATGLAFKTVLTHNILDSETGTVVESTFNEHIELVVRNEALAAVLKNSAVESWAQVTKCSLSFSAPQALSRSILYRLFLPLCGHPKLEAELVSTPSSLNTPPVHISANTDSGAPRRPKSVAPTPKHQFESDNKISNSQPSLHKLELREEAQQLPLVVPIIEDPPIVAISANSTALLSASASGTISGAAASTLFRPLALHSVAVLEGDMQNANGKTPKTEETKQTAMRKH